MRECARVCVCVYEGEGHYQKINKKVIKEKEMQKTYERKKRREEKK